jgi:hypothetical protein
METNPVSKKLCSLVFLEYQMDKIQKPSNSECYTPLSEPFRIYPWHSAWTEEQPLPLYDFRTRQCILARENVCTVKEQIETNGGHDSDVETLPPGFVG